MDNKNCLFEFSMTPLDKGESVSLYVCGSLDVIDKSGLDYKINPMGTVIEGSWEECVAVLTDCYYKMKESCNRITCSVKIDYRKDSSKRLTSKIKSVEQKLNKKLKQ